MYREVHVVEVREVLRLWLREISVRRIARLSGIDRKTVQRYVVAAEAAGLDRDVGEDQLSDALAGEVTHEMQSRGPGRHGATWRFCEEHRERLKAWIDEGLKLTNVRGTGDPSGRPSFRSRLGRVGDHEERGLRPANQSTRTGG